MTSSTLFMITPFNAFSSTNTLSTRFLRNNLNKAQNRIKPRCGYQKSEFNSKIVEVLRKEKEERISVTTSLCLTFLFSSNFQSVGKIIWSRQWYWKAFHQLLRAETFKIEHKKLKNWGNMVDSFISAKISLLHYSINLFCHILMKYYDILLPSRLELTQMILEAFVEKHPVI